MEVIKMEREYMRNDIFWTFCRMYKTSKGYEFFHYKHWGYNDDNYWNNVIPNLDKIVTVIGDKGTEKKFNVDFIHNTATEVE